MPFCPICGRDHDPDIGCSDATGQAIRDLGLPRAGRRPEDTVSPNAGRQYKRAAVWVPGYRWSRLVDRMATPRCLMKSRVGDDGNRL
jgi:hypothetical protein